MRCVRWLVVVILLFGFLGIPPIQAVHRAPSQPSSDTDTPTNQRIRRGRISLSFYAVKGALIQEILEKLGHPVTAVKGSHGEIFPQLGRGSVDLLVAAWLPYTHSLYWDEYGDRAVRLAPLYSQAKLFWAVPEFVPEDAVSSIGDLTRSRVVSRMNKSIVGVGPGSGLETRSREAMDAYGLKEAGYRYRTGSLSEWSGAQDSSFENRGWAVFPLWQPLYLNRVYDVRPVRDPERTLGFSDVAYLVAHKSFLERVPDSTRRALSEIRLSIQSVTCMDYLVNVEGKTPGEAARQWMRENSEVVSTWLMAAGITDKS